MQLPPLQSATLIRRYKRFLADVQLDNGEVLTIHCANTGAMTGCGEAGDIVWYSHSNSQTRKYPHSWELTELKNGNMVCINTHRSNQLTLEALQNKQINPLAMYEQILPEVKYGEENSRIDFLLKGDGLPDCYVEVKSVTLVKNTIGMFPDAVTTRGQKHLRELIAMKKLGHRAVVFFAGLHNGFDCFKVAEYIDPEYDKLLQEAIQEGVEVYAYAGKFDFSDKKPTALSLTHCVPYIGKK
ncbi:DNA/RNA nuclease SfsA [Pasteurella multocida]|uniref:DNA/RNA nuclease SfsA n=1 Tax=Pasteurella multocida TaxID=747 RepID=UPI000BBD2FB9|nr:DNA/RNA nuclease SfsA [Pasteurella multocida]ATF74080.1 DNA/RNA nuclease SfsA [Pasteurella multocida]ATN16480.1 DNA/RNA nuclease SfsA [Pasteurella multocida]MEB3451619.1 DNA/RNA nuclease SfsA [Pasteurella multocida]MEB3452789.1 DNA/RNA nuclease SfsA [Pasteurella multocida]MEB3454975.1 DNA/RNA nuclease SfsA [Pasteurella multocida]